jgi:hypothetical protein
MQLELHEHSILEKQFLTFHRENLQVYDKLVELAFILKNRGHRKIGIAMLFEQLRWLHALETTDISGFKLNNNHAAFYSRMIMDRNTALDGFFKVREQAR